MRRSKKENPTVRAKRRTEAQAATKRIPKIQRRALRQATVRVRKEEMMLSRTRT